MKRVLFVVSSLTLVVKCHRFRDIASCTIQSIASFPPDWPESNDTVVLPSMVVYHHHYLPCHHHHHLAVVVGWSSGAFPARGSSVQFEALLL